MAEARDPMVRWRIDERHLLRGGPVLLLDLLGAHRDELAERRAHRLQIAQVSSDVGAGRAALTWGGQGRSRQKGHLVAL